MLFIWGLFFFHRISCAIYPEPLPFSSDLVCYILGLIPYQWTMFVIYVGLIPLPLNQVCHLCMANFFAAAPGMPFM